jgi:hypothetical protein
MRAASSISSLFRKHLTSLRHTHLSHPPTPPPRRSRTAVPSLPFRYCPTAGSYSPAPHSRDRMTYSSSADFTSSKQTSSTVRATSKRKGCRNRNRSRGSQRKHWLEKRCVSLKTFTLKELKGSKCTGTLSSHTGGRKVMRKSGRDCSSFTEARWHPWI